MQYGSLPKLIALPDGRLAAFGVRDQLHIWSAKIEGNPEMVATQRLDALAEAIVLRDGRIAVVANSGVAATREVHVLSSAGDRRPLVLGGHRPWSLIELPDGRLASGTEEGTIVIWNLKPVGAPKVVGIDVTSTAKPKTPGRVVLADGREASPLENNGILIWDPADPLQAVVLKGHDALVYSMVALQGNRLVSAALDGTVRLWDLRPTATSTVLANDHSLPLMRKPDPTALIAIADGRLAYVSKSGLQISIWGPDVDNQPTVFGSDWIIQRAIALADGRLATIEPLLPTHVQIWDLALGTPVAIIKLFEQVAEKLEALPDGRLLLASGGRLEAWDIFPAGQALIDKAKELVPRCLTPKERAALHLPEAQPEWCRALKKWPTNGAAN